MIKPFLDRQGPAATPRQHCSQITVQFNRHLKFKAWVKDGVKDAFRKAPDRVTVKAWVKAVQH